MRLIILAVTGFLAAGQAYAQTAAPQSILDMDANHDGVVTRAEFDAEALAAATFARVDVDHSGGLSHEERTRGRPGATIDTATDASDPNHDGIVVRAEFDRNRARVFTRMDQNNDGQLSGAELATAPPVAPPAATP